MSEYWKSTPKYWCKYCKTFVRDTKLERTNHDATPKHQGNIKRFLRDLHRGHEKDEREKQRAKNEVERLNGVVSGTPTSASGSADTPWQRTSAIPANNGPRQATPAERKAQLAQLASMGVAVPEDYRREMAMAGDWQTMSEKLVYEDVKKEQNTEDVQPSSSTGDSSKINIGVRKRKFEGQDEEEEAGEKVVRKGWGSTIRAYPGTSQDPDLDALLNENKPFAYVDNTVDEGRQLSTHSKSVEQSGSMDDGEAPSASGPTPIKREDTNVNEALANTESSANPQDIKQEEDLAAGGIVFKKRKAKSIRQK